MEKVQTTNLISTPNIEGNIGSCSVTSDKIQIDEHLFTSEWKTVQVNSCTGEIISQYEFISYTGVWVTLIVGFLLILIVLGVLADSHSY